LLDGAVAAQLTGRQIAEADAQSEIDMPRDGAAETDLDVVGMRTEDEEIHGGHVGRRHADMLPGSRYSCRSATSGAMFAARRAGSGVSASGVAARANAAGSVGVNSNSSERATPADIAAAADPNATPQATMMPTSRSTSTISDARSAPSAIRTPSSFVRRAT